MRMGFKYCVQAIPYGMKLNIFDDESILASFEDEPTINRVA